MKRMLTILIMFFLLIILSGCTPPRKFTAETLIGVWVESDSRNLSFSKDQIPCFEFSKDGRFKAFNYPEAILFEGGLPNSQHVNGSGQWTYLPEKAFLGNVEIDLEFNPNRSSKFTDGFGTELFATSIQIEDVDRLFTWPEESSIFYLKKDPEKKACQ